VSYTLEEVRVLAKREPFRAGVRMRYVMPRISVRVTRWILNNAPSVTPNQLTLVSGLLGIAAGLLLLVPSGIAAALAAFLVYQVHILFDYVDGELARVRGMESPLGAYYDLMVGRLTKPVILFSAAVGASLSHTDPGGQARNLLVGALIVLGFFLDKEAVDVWYRANVGRTNLEDPYVVQSERSVTGWPRTVARTTIGLLSIQAFFVYHIIAALVTQLGVDRVRLGSLNASPRGLVLIVFAVAFPVFAVVRAVYISRTGHIPRRQDLVINEGPRAG
jgi:phosphatidylglycerophosphate synthase